jgi:hypothetical protein
MVDPVAILARTAALAYSGTLTGNRAPYIEARYQRMTHPQVGDLVVELTTARREPFDPSCVGWLQDVRDEPVTTEEEWLADGNALPVPLDRYWYLVTLSGEPARWSNCSFISIPDGREEDWLARSTPSFRGGF